jgi:Cdc6-like AAA superfamily ATPase
VATVGVLDMEKDYEKIIADFSGDITGDLIDKFNEKSQAITQFKEVIKKVLDNLPNDQKNLIIFIDELDRCRPTYAIELLERIKHLFDIERLVFILSTDTEQLSHSICAVYGNDFDAKKYLNRFIDLDYSLKEPDLRKYIQWHFENSLINDYHKKRQYGEQNKKNLLINLIFFFARRFNLKLRDVNLLMTRVLLGASQLGLSINTQKG